MLISGSEDKSLIVWEHSLEVSKLIPKHVLSGHMSYISGIIRLSEVEIICGEYGGDLRIWNIRDGICIIYIPRTTDFDYLSQIKIFRELNANIRVALCSERAVTVWGADNNWEVPYKVITQENGGLGNQKGYSIELLSGNIMLRGGDRGILEFIDYTQMAERLLPPIALPLKNIYELKRIGRNIVVFASMDGTLRVIDPFLRKCYFIFYKNIQSYNVIIKLD